MNPNLRRLPGPVVFLLALLGTAICLAASIFDPRLQGLAALGHAAILAGFFWGLTR